MLPISQNTLKTLAQKDEDGNKLMEIRDGDVAVFTGYVAMSISGFSPLDNGLRDFEGAEKAGQVIFPWLNVNLNTATPYQLFIPLMTLHYLHGVVKKWFKARPKNSDMPYVMVEIKEVDGDARIHIQGSGQDKELGLELVFDLPIEDLDVFGEASIAFTAKEFVDFLELFAKLKAENETATLYYGDSKTYLYAHNNGHTVIAATPFNDEAVGIERKTGLAMADSNIIQIGVAHAG